MRGDSVLLPCKVSQLTIATDGFTGQLPANLTPHCSSRGPFTVTKAFTSSILRRSITERTSYITRITHKILAHGETDSNSADVVELPDKCIAPAAGEPTGAPKSSIWLHSQMGHALPLRDDMQSLKEHRAEGGRDKERGRRVPEPV
ncbi:hypothetical protein E4U40_006141 [Claviceps sp. LM458 group G5]|nr:hypothetical protein E4U40_006141 [Claviceps sp. LM458 group G5]